MVGRTVERPGARRPERADSEGDSGSAGGGVLRRRGLGDERADIQDPRRFTVPGPSQPVRPTSRAAAAVRDTDHGRSVLGPPGRGRARCLRESAPGPAAADRVIPSWPTPVAAQASEAVGGPCGRHAVVGRACSGRRCGSACSFASFVLALAWIKQAPCSDGDWTG